jgi:CBS domain-containing protein
MTIARLIEDKDANIHACTVSMTVRMPSRCLPKNDRRGAGADGHAIAGIFSERDVITRLKEHGAAVLDMAVGQVMTSPAITVDPGTQVLEALGLMTRRRIRHLPVLDGGRMVAFVSIGDLVKYRIDHIEGEANALRDYIQMA